MYPRPAFTETDPQRIADLITANPFGLLVTNSETGMDASHVPFVVEQVADPLILVAHLGRPNPQSALLDGGQALAIFSGPHAYIAPGWYKTQPAVPTWDFAAVHVHGKLEAVDDYEPAATIVRELARDDPMNFDMDLLPEKFRLSMMRGIRAFRLRAERIEAQWKMSQNRSIEDRQGVIAALRAQGNDAVADLIAATII